MGRYLAGGMRSASSTAMPLLMNITMKIVQPQVEVAAESVIVVVEEYSQGRNEISCSAS